MTYLAELERARRAEALRSLEGRMRAEMASRWPAVNFDDDLWPTNTTYKTKLLDVKFSASRRAFKHAEPSYLTALRCLMALIAVEGKTKFSLGTIGAWRLMAEIAVETHLTDLRRHHLISVEERLVRMATRVSAQLISQKLLILSRLVDELGRVGVIDRLKWHPSRETKSSLRALSKDRDTERKAAKAAVLDRQIESFSEATAAMLTGDSRLTDMDRSAIAATNLLMCAPSRINETLTLKASDRYTLNDYTEAPANGSSQLHSAHQLLLMKGSKGAPWSPKPVLNFMIGLTDHCWKLILELGTRSRTLLQWYEKHPDQLYLPEELEHLRGRPLSKNHIWQIINLTTATPKRSALAAIHVRVWNVLTAPEDGSQPVPVLTIENPTPMLRDGLRKTASPSVNALPWAPVERLLLARVRSRIGGMREVAPGNFFDGKLSEMLMLVDSEVTPYLPQAWCDEYLRRRLKHNASRAARNMAPSVFIKLGLKMVENGKLVDSYLEPHDTRRWLTSQALIAHDRLSDVLINKWANRLSLGQLAAYDLRTEDQKAEQAAMPLPNELLDLSEGLHSLQRLESQYGLETAVLVAHGHGVSVTSMESICSATEDRPVAKVGSDIIILYPNRFGACLHQHHEAPCRSYVCPGCDELIAVKGHRPTNDEWRREAELTNRSILNQLRNLITAHNRGTADCQESFGQHLQALVRRGLDVESMTAELIQRFHQVKEHIRDPNLKRSLELAHVANGVVERLEDPGVNGGALIKYHNPARHASPGHERAIESHFGSRRDMDARSELFYQRHPEFAPLPANSRDQRHLLAGLDEKDSDEAA